MLRPINALRPFAWSVERAALDRSFSSPVFCIANRVLCRIPSPPSGFFHAFNCTCAPWTGYNRPDNGLMPKNPAFKPVMRGRSFPIFFLVSLLPPIVSTVRDKMVVNVMFEKRLNQLVKKDARGTSTLELWACSIPLKKPGSDQAEEEMGRFFALSLITDSCLLDVCEEALSLPERITYYAFVLDWWKGISPEVSYEGDPGSVTYAKDLVRKVAKRIVERLLEKINMGGIHEDDTMRSLLARVSLPDAFDCPLTNEDKELIRMLWAFLTLITSWHILPFERIKREVCQTKRSHIEDIFKKLERDRNTLVIRTICVVCGWFIGLFKSLFGCIVGLFGWLGRCVVRVRVHGGSK